MEILSKDDLFKLKKRTLIAEYDFDTLVTLYQPIVGYQAISLYMTFWSMTKHSSDDETFVHENIFLKMIMDPGVFVRARKKLEAVNLLKTKLIKSDKDNDLYIYSLRAPETPKNFFDNVLLYGLLTRSLGERESTKVKCLYKYDGNEDGGIDISATISKVFDRQEEQKLLKLLEDRDNIVGRVRARLQIKFDYDLFIRAITSSSQIKEESITQEHLKEIERIATLYGVNETNMALIVIDSFNYGEEADKRIDFKNIMEQCMMYDKIPLSINDKKGGSTVRSSSDLGNKINMMETMSPKEFLQVKQNNTKPVKPDLILLDDLSRTLNLSPSVINALIDYVLMINNNVLSRNYVMKIGAALAREKVNTTYDAMAYLKKTNHFKMPSYAETKKQRDVEKKKAEESVKENVSEEELNEMWDNLMKEMEEGNGKD